MRQAPIFLYENVVPKSKQVIGIISEYLGVEPIMINSNLVSAQDRKRLYWTNIPNIEQPKDKGLFLKDIVGFSSEIPAIEETIGELKKFTSRAFEVSISKEGRIRPYRLDAKKSGLSEIGTLASTSGKSATITATHAPKTYKSNPFKVLELSVSECEELQTVPIGYTAIASERQAKKMLGNGWTVDVIAHIFRFLS
jgi:site-specific DNA-cytosine methylase